MARESWDIVLVDTPGHQSTVVHAVLVGSSGVVVPMVPEAGPVTELPTILNTIRGVTNANGHAYELIQRRGWRFAIPDLA